MENKIVYEVDRETPCEEDLRFILNKLDLLTKRLQENSECQNE